MVVKLGAPRAIPASGQSQAFYRVPIPGCPKAEVVLKACWQGYTLLHFCTELQSFYAGRQSRWGRHGRIPFSLQQKVFSEYSVEFKKAKRRRKGIDSVLGKRSRRSEEHEKMNRHHEDISCKGWEVPSVDGDGESKQGGSEDVNQSLARNKFRQDFSTSGNFWDRIAPGAEDSKVSPEKGERQRETTMVPKGTQDYVIDELLKIAKLELPEDLRNGDTGHQVVLLQRAMFLLGYLPDVSSLTGYFGSETRAAVGNFQHANNILNTGHWDSRTRQALLKYLASFEKNNGSMNRVSASLRDSAKQGFGDGSWCWATAQKPSRGLSELFTSSSRDRSTGYGRFCIGTLILVLFVCLIYIRHSISQIPQPQSVKKRILRSQWFVEGNRRIGRRKLLQRTKRQQVQTTLNRSSPKNRRGDAHHCSGLGLHGVMKNGFGEDIQMSSYSKVSSHPITDTSGPSAAFCLSSLNQNYNSHRSEASQQSRSAAADTQDKAEQASMNILELARSCFTSIFPLCKQHSQKSNSSASNGTDMIRSIAERKPRHPSVRGTKVELGTHGRNAYLRSDPPARWMKEDELDLKDRIEELHKSVLAAEENRKAAMRALTEEKRRSLELEVKIRRQKEAAIALEEEVRVLKESHDTLLQSLRKKYSSSVSARAAAALLYQTWETTDEGNTQKHSS